jgi:hypothetical protein
MMANMKFLGKMLRSVDLRCAATGYASSLSLQRT